MAKSISLAKQPRTIPRRRAALRQGDTMTGEAAGAFLASTRALSPFSATFEACRDIALPIRQRQSQVHAIQSVATQHRRTLGGGNISLQKKFHGYEGRLLAYFPDENLACGVAEAETQGFFTVDNVPPWDTWVAYLHEDDQTNYLVALGSGSVDQDRRRRHPRDPRRVRGIAGCALPAFGRVVRGACHKVGKRTMVERKPITVATSNRWVSLPPALVELRPTKCSTHPLLPHRHPDLQPAIAGSRIELLVVALKTRRVGRLHA